MGANSSDHRGNARFVNMTLNAMQKLVSTVSPSGSSSNAVATP